MWRAERLAARREALEERGDRRHGEAQAIAAGRRVGLAGGGEQALEVREVLDGLARVVAARVPRDLVGAGDQADRRRTREQGERAADVRVRNGIAVPVKAHVRRSCRRRPGASRRCRRDAPGSGKRRGCSCGEDLGDGLIALLGMRALMRDVVAPAAKLRVQVVDIGKRPRGKERIAEVLNLALDLAFFVRPSGRARPRGKMIVPGELEQARMKPNGTALAFEDGTAQVVVDQGPGHASEQAMKGVDVAAQKTLERLIQGEERRHGARVGQDHHEAGERACAVADPDRAKGPPINLCLFAMESFP